MTTATLPPPTLDKGPNYTQQRVAHWEALARRPGAFTLGGYYHRRLAQSYRLLIPAGQRVLEVGCGRGDLLAAVAPALGVGVDFCPAVLAAGRQRHPDLHFVLGDAHDFALDHGPFDAIILSDLLGDVYDVQQVLNHLHRFCTPRTRLLLNFYSRVWQLPLGGTRRLGLASPLLEQNWLAPADVENLLFLADFQVVRRWQDVLLPLGVPLVAPLCNRYLSRLWPFRAFALTNLVVARPVRVTRGQAPPAAAPAPGAPATPPAPRAPIVSVIVPARNEEGNVPEIIRRVPEMAGGTELVFVEGNSTDHTWQAIQEAVRDHPGRRCLMMQQTGKGKGDAVRLGMARATGDIVLILDADLTVPPEDLPRFVAALTTGKGEFVNGVRLVYPMEHKAMRWANLVANKFFSLAFSWLLEQPIKDTLCGTKVMWKDDYQVLVANRRYFGDFDPFGDFDLLFGAAKLGLKIVEIPIRYRERTYGETNIQRWRHGVLLLRMCAFAARRLKFV